MADNTATDIASIPSAPALSATSDMPVIVPETTAEPAQTEAAATETPAAEAAAEDTGAEDDAAPEASEVAPAKPDRSLSGRLSQRTRERNEAFAERDKLASLLEKAIERLGTPPAADPAAKPVELPPDPRPKRDSFEDPESYDAALIEWSSRQSALLVKSELERQEAARRQDDERRRQEETRTQEISRVQENWNKTVAEIKTDPHYADFDDVAFNPELMIPQGMVPLIAEAGPKVLYWLGQHPDEAQRIAALNPLQQSFELGAIRHRVATARVQVSKAPAPVEPVRGVNRATAKAPEEMTMEEYAATRVPVLQKERANSMFGNRTN